MFFVSERRYRPPQPKKNSNESSRSSSPVESDSSPLWKLRCVHQNIAATESTNVLRHWLRLYSSSYLVIPSVFFFLGGGGDEERGDVTVNRTVLCVLLEQRSPPQMIFGARSTTVRSRTGGPYKKGSFLDRPIRLLQTFFKN